MGAAPEIIVSLDVAMAALKGREPAFVMAYIQDPIGTKAAKQAGYTGGNLNVRASRLLKMERVQTAIQAHRREMSKKANIDATWILTRLAEMANVDIVEMFKDDGTLKDISEMPRHARRVITGIKVSEIFDGQGPQRRLIGHQKEIKLVDPVKLIELIGRHVNVNAFRPDMTLNLPIVTLRDFTGRQENGTETPELPVGPIGGDVDPPDPIDEGEGPGPG